MDELKEATVEFPLEVLRLIIEQGSCENVLAMARTCKAVRQICTNVRTYTNVVANGNGIHSRPPHWTKDDISTLAEGTTDWWQNAIDLSGATEIRTIQKWCLADSKARQWVINRPDACEWTLETSTVPRLLHWLPQLLATDHPILRSRHFPTEQLYNALRPLMGTSNPIRIAKGAALSRAYFTVSLVNQGMLDHISGTSGVGDRLGLHDEKIPNDYDTGDSSSAESDRRMVSMLHFVARQWAISRFEQAEILTDGGEDGEPDPVMFMPVACVGHTPYHLLCHYRAPFDDTAAQNSTADHEMSKAWLEDGMWSGWHSDIFENAGFFEGSQRREELKFRCHTDDSQHEKVELDYLSVRHAGTMSTTDGHLELEQPPDRAEGFELYPTPFGLFGNWWDTPRAESAHEWLWKDTWCSMEKILPRTPSD